MTLASEMFFAMAAGSDTTASVIRNIMLHLMTSPHHYRKLKETVLRAAREGTTSSPIKQEEAKKLPYLQVRDPQLPPSPTLTGRLPFTKLNTTSC